MTTATLSFSKVQQKVQAISFPEINWKMVCLMGFFISLILVVFYVWQINYLTTGYYLINSYENQISKLSDENKNLQVSFAESSFLGQVQQEAQDLNFQKVTSVEYIQVPDSSVGYNYEK